MNGVTGKGGRREGAGRKPLPEQDRKKRRVIFATDAEWQLLEKEISRIIKPAGK